MLGAVFRVPAPIPSLFPAPTRPLLLCRRSHRLPSETPMAAAAPRDGGATKPDAAPAPVPVPQPPEKPLLGDCCGSGCVRCVWDIYYDELDAYEKALAAHAASGGKASPADSKPTDGAKS